MRGLRFLFFIVIPLSFAFGLGWGWKIRRDRAALGVETPSVKVVRVLSLPNLAPRSALTDYETARVVKVEVEEAATPADLIRAWDDLKAKGVEPDLVTLLYSQIPDVSRALKLQPLELSRLPTFQRISKDFVDWPRSNEWPTTAPIAWGFDGWALAKPPAGKKVLWVATLARTAGSADADEAHALADHLLSRAVAVARVKASGFASTSLETETAPEVARESKPSHLRAQPLTDYVLDEIAVTSSDVTAPESE